MAKCAIIECGYVEIDGQFIPEIRNDYDVYCSDISELNVNLPSTPDPNSGVFKVSASDAVATQIDADSNYDGANLSDWIDYDDAETTFEDVLKVWLNG